MSGRTKPDGAAAVVVGAAACVACCAGPILGFLGAIGIGTLVSVVLFGVAGLAVAAIGTLVLVLRRRRAITPASDLPVPVDMSTAPRSP
jgi:hypothetical protein